MDNKHASVTDLKARLDKLDNELGQREAKTQQAKADAQSKHQARLSLLRQKRNAARQKYNELQGSRRARLGTPEARRRRRLVRAQGGAGQGARRVQINHEAGAG
jgi:peptidoglycan hydrolase CwlO-like protein